jgi:glucan phosphoethanolaminetransferase (alkaline phosphatase superfamily)
LNIQEMKKNSWIVNGLSGLGLLCFIWFLYLMFFGSIKDDNIILFLITCVGVLLFPISALYKNGIETVEIKKGVIIAVCSLLVIIILIFFTGRKGSDYIDKLFITLVSEPYRWLYLIMLVIACICVVAKNRIGVWLTAILLGIIAPAIIAAVLYVILFVIAIIFVLLFGSKGSNSWSSILSSPSTSNTNPAPKKAQAPRKSVSTDVGNNKNSNSTSEEEKRRQKEIDFLTTGWTYGVARFKGRQPSSGMLLGGVNVWYNGSLTQTSVNGGVQIWEGTGDICVAYPRNYTGPKMEFYSSGGTVQIQVC